MSRGLEQLDFFSTPLPSKAGVSHPRKNISKPKTPKLTQKKIKYYRPLFFPKKVYIPLTQKNYEFIFEIKDQQSIFTKIDQSCVYFSGLVKHRPTLKKGVRKFFNMIAQQHIGPRVSAYSEKTKLYFQDLRFKNQKSRWGSCSELKNINLNIRLLFLPIDLIDYVIIHELCHLKHLNHSKAFWALVASHCPDYKLHEKQLESTHKFVPKWVFGI